ncbi:MAG: hypothetical protein HQL10_03255 [Nitrospirae bacterium]|nr:hypothetical protein [Nitrospirota bacterium]
MSKVKFVTGIVFLAIFFSAQIAFPLNIDAVEKAQYVGSKACEKCHVRIYTGWTETLHTKKIQLANEYTVVGDFTNNNKLTVEKDGKKFVTTMKKKDGKFYINTYGPDGKAQEYLVGYTIGGTWQQRYMTKFSNGAYKVLPVQWNVKTSEWVDYRGLKTATPGSGKYWSDKVNTWQTQCGSCHVTNLEFEYDEKNDTFKDTKWADNGAGCEACHGPGSKHIEAATEAEKREAIINPRKLPTFVGAMICGQCHARGISTDSKYEYPKGFKPGKMLTEYFVEKPVLWPNGSSKCNGQQYSDWKKSGHANYGVNCWTCHEVHRKGVTERYSLKSSGWSVCLSCHSGETDKSERSIHSLHGVIGCATCHMPRTAQSAVPNDISDHSFRVILPQESINKGGTDKQPNSCNLCHYHKNDSPESLVKYLKRLKKDSLEPAKKR